MAAASRVLSPTIVVVVSFPRYAMKPIRLQRKRMHALSSSQDAASSRVLSETSTAKLLVAARSSQKALLMPTHSPYQYFDTAYSGCRAVAAWYVPLSRKIGRSTLPPALIQNKRSMPPGS